MNKREANEVCKVVTTLLLEAKHETRKAAAKELRVTADALRNRIKNLGYNCMCYHYASGGMKCTASKRDRGVSGVTRRRRRK
jgi:hypothetical protein